MIENPDNLAAATLALIALTMGFAVWGGIAVGNWMWDFEGTGRYGWKGIGLAACSFTCCLLALATGALLAH